MDIYGLLTSNGIKEGGEYGIDEILSIIHGKYGENSVIRVCVKDRATDTLYFDELRFCLDLNYHPGEC